MNNFLLDFIALGAILSGILVITSKNPVISVLFLISVFVNVAGYLVLLGIGFLGISYLIVYVGAISILFLFVVMMLNLQLAELTAVGSEYTQNLPLGTIVGGLFLFEVVSILPSSFKDTGYFSLSNFSQGMSDISIAAFHSINNFFMPYEMSATTVYHGFNTSSVVDTTFTNYLQIQSIGTVLYTHCSMWILVASVILLLAMVGPITLSMNKQNSE